MGDPLLAEFVTSPISFLETPVPVIRERGFVVSPDFLPGNPRPNRK